MVKEKHKIRLIDGVVSVVMPVYNETVYLREAIRSVLQQTYISWELWIVDDGSTIDVRSAVSDLLADERIHFLRLFENRGRYLAFLDSDDVWLPAKLEKQIRFMQETAVPVSFTSYRRFRGTVKKCWARGGGASLCGLCAALARESHRLLDGSGGSVALSSAGNAFGTA